MSHLQKSLPKLGCLEELIEISQRYSLYNLSRLKEKGPGYEVAKEKAAFYLKHQKTVDPVLSAIRSARDHFTRNNRTNVSLSCQQIKQGSKHPSP